MTKTLLITTILIIAFISLLPEKKPYTKPEKKLYTKPENLNVKISKNMTSTCRNNGNVIVEYSLGKLDIPCKYYKTGHVSSSFASVDIIFLWPSLKGVREVKGSDWFGKDSVRLFTTFEGSASSMRSGGDSYERTMTAITSSREVTKTKSKIYDGLIEYRVQKSKTYWQLYYMADDQSLLTPGGNPLVFGCGQQFGDLDNNDCSTIWRIDESMWILIQFKGHMLRSWPELYRDIIHIYSEMAINQ